ncbi:transposon-encoded TnpW family protein, partial [Intestinimonas butyriciproducens]
FASKKITGGCYLMENTKNPVPEMIREYQIGNTCYVVKSRSKEQAQEDAVTKVKRLIRNDLKQ